MKRMAHILLRDEDVISWSISFLEDYRLAQGKISSTSQSLGEVSVKWCKPDVGFYKINTDAAINGKSQKFGCCGRNSSQLVAASSVQCISACLSPQAAEASAILMGFHVVVEANLLPVVLESDAKWVVESINDIRPSYTDIGIIFTDIVDVMSEFSISCFLHF
ncbi:hypothetical protein Dsin_004765 [Dipteronia sinensis]|uniref:RNase H type-1 domain-containing protein n=1 Tax=Dipteronia sinensis TaxID=43782 RepID=A0AAE0EE00_9ROSI|nr:hypothetical protein Dsin_004765 [Dipteronia sinensis]